MALHDDIHRHADRLVERAEDRHHELDEALRTLERATDPDLHIWYLADSLEAGLDFLVHDSLLGRTGRDFHRRLEAVRHHHRVAQFSHGRESTVCALAWGTPAPAAPSIQHLCTVREEAEFDRAARYRIECLVDGQPRTGYASIAEYDAVTTAAARFVLIAEALGEG